MTMTATKTTPRARDRAERLGISVDAVLWLDICGEYEERDVPTLKAKADEIGCTLDGMLARHAFRRLRRSVARLDGE